MSQITQLTKIPLAGTKKGVISISNVTEPYGTGTPDVVSIGIALNGADVEWKAHIPYDNIDEVVKALQEAKAKH
jgi:hypothetical protein